LLEWPRLNLIFFALETDESFPSDLPIEEVPVYIASQKFRFVRTLNSIKDMRRIFLFLAADL
jgi:hypothetical protein